MHTRFAGGDRIFKCFIAFLTLTVFSRADAMAMTVAENGNARAIILLPAEPTTVETYAAGAMADALKRITGGTFAIVHEHSDSSQSADQPVISIGRTTLATGVEVQGPEWKRNNREAFRILRRDNALIIAGNARSDISDQGALWGVYAFLETQGVGSYLPDSSGDVFPSIPTLSIDAIDISDAPWFSMRGGGNIVAGHLRRYQPGGDKAGQTLGFMDLFNRTGTARKVEYFHMWHHVITPEVRKEHPEWFKDAHNPKYGPQPTPDLHVGYGGPDASICLTNDGVRKLFIEHFRKQFAADPEPYGATICADDFLIGDRCDCANCQRLMSASAPPTFTVRSPRSSSDLHIDFVNAVAEGLEDEFPDRKLVTYAYLDYLDPPTKTRVHKNVIVMIAPLDSPDEMHPAIDSVARGWREMGAQEIYWYSYVLSRPPIPWLMGQWFQNYKKLGIDGVYLEFSPNVGAFSALNAWMQAKLMWNPDADVGALVDEYCTGLFGPEVGNLMRRFFFAWEAKPPFADEDIPALLAAAEAKAGGPDTEIGKRVGMFTHAYQLWRSAIDVDSALKRNDFAAAAGAARAGISADKALKENYPSWALGANVVLKNYASAAGYGTAVLPALERAMKTTDAIRHVPEPSLPGPAVCLTNNADLPGSKRRKADITVNLSPPLSGNGGGADRTGAKLFDGEVHGAAHTIDNGPFTSFVIDVNLNGDYQVERVEVCTGMNVGAGSLMQIQTVPIYIDVEIGTDGQNFTTVDRIFPRTLSGFVQSDRLMATTRFVRLVSHSLNMGHEINEVRIWGRSKKKAVNENPCSDVSRKPIPSGVVEHTGIGPEGGIAELRSGSLFLAQGESYRTSTDGAESWSDAQPLNCEIGAGGMIRLRSGSLAIHGSAGGKHFFASSSDDGKTWSKPVLITDHPTFCPLYHAMIQLRTGRLLFAGYTTLMSWDEGNGTMISVHPDLQYADVSAYGSWRGQKIAIEGHGHAPEMGMTVVYRSDDEGKTWTKHPGGLMGWFDFDGVVNGNCGLTPCFEPTLAETRDGSVLLMMRSTVGRLVQSFSTDGGEHWNAVTPSNLASSESPAIMVTLPKTGDLLIVWNQQSREEIRRGYRRGRLSSAISRDGGHSWEHFKTLELCEGLEDIEHVQPESPIQMVRARDWVGPLPDGWAYYHYANLDLVDGNVIIRYNRGGPLLGIAEQNLNKQETVMRVYPIDWFYE